MAFSRGREEGGEVEQQQPRERRATGGLFIVKLFPFCLNSNIAVMFTWWRIVLYGNYL